MNEMNQLKEVVFQFIERDDNVVIKPLGKGHINDSYRVAAGDNEYVLQRINHNIFKNVPQLQDNIQRVTSHIRGKLEEQGAADIDRKVLTLATTGDGALFHQDKEGNYWRMMDFITDSKSYEEITPELAYRAGKAFGDFQSMLADLPGEPLHETIPNFHNMETRLADFREAVKANKAGRLDEVADLVQEIEDRPKRCARPKGCTAKGSSQANKPLRYQSEQRAV